jgi:hypothetical protein
VEALAIIGARARKQSGLLPELADVSGGENPYIDGDVAHAGGIVVRQIPTTVVGNSMTTVPAITGMHWGSQASMARRSP